MGPVTLTAGPLGHQPGNWAQIGQCHAQHCTITPGSTACPNYAPATQAAHNYLISTEGPRDLSSLG
eukprot:10645453-Lingulodinium_polyedra.AAC.1